MATQTKLVAVYGSLKQGFGAHEILGDEKEFIGNGIIHNYGLYGVSSWPGIKPLVGGKVAVELYRVSEDRIPHLDSYEGYPDLFSREVLDVFVGEEEHYQASVYVYNGEVRKEAFVESGVWARRPVGVYL